MGVVSDVGMAGAAVTVAWGDAATIGEMALPRVAVAVGDVAVGTAVGLGRGGAHAESIMARAKRVSEKS